MKLKPIHYYLIGLGALVIIGLIIGLFLAGNSNYIKPLPQPIQHYTDQRDDLTKPKPIELNNSAITNESCGQVGQISGYWLWFLLIVGIGVVTFMFHYGGVGSLGSMIGMVVVILVGINLIPTVASQACLAIQQQVNTTGINNTMATTLLNNVTVFYTVGIMAAALAIVCMGLRKGGLL